MVNDTSKKNTISSRNVAFLESYVSDIFTFTPSPLSFINLEGVILDLNPAFLEIANIKIKDIFNGRIESFFDEVEIKELIKDTFNEGFVNGREMRFFPVNKPDISVQAFTKIRSDGDNKLGYFLSLFDLTEIKRTQRDSRKALLGLLEDIDEKKVVAEEEKNKTLAIIRNFADGIMVFDAKNNLSLINPKIEDFFKIERKKIIGKSIVGLSKIKSLKELTDIFKKGEVFRKDLKVGDIISEITIVPVKREGAKIGTLVILHDITRENLIEKMKSEFVSLAAHQLRTPLSAIKWITRMLLDEELGKLNNDQKEFLTDSYDSNERMIRLVNDLLNVTKIEEGRYLYKLTLGDIVEIAKLVIDSYRGPVTRRKLKLVFIKPKKEILGTMMDTEKVRMVVENLIDNSMKYNKPGGRIIVSIKEIDGNIQVSVKDTGIGITKKEQNRVFDKFFRGADVVKMDTEGTGLGLFITKNIVEAHNGKIWFESEYKNGSTFYFSIPVKKK